MADSKQDIVLEWLRDAHSKGQQARDLYQKQADRLRNYPEVQTRFNEYVDQSKRHQRMLEGAIDRLGGSTSVIKDLGGKVMAWGQSLSGLPMSDEVVKGVMFCYTFQQMGIAAFRVLIVAAEEAGDHETKTICEDIMQEDQVMADWIYERIPQITREYMRREERGDTV